MSESPTTKDTEKELAEEALAQEKEKDKDVIKLNKDRVE